MANAGHFSFTERGNVNDNYPISNLVHETVCQRLEGQKTSAIKCDSCKEKWHDLWLFLTKYI